jgi:hypothetical protein
MRRQETAAVGVSWELVNLLHMSAAWSVEFCGQELPAGPVRLELGFVDGPGRITELCMHLTVDTAVHHDVPPIPWTVVELVRGITMADAKQGTYDPKKGGKFAPTTKAKPPPPPRPGHNKDK